ncbi:MAG: hypothetical protein BWX88_03836 [Planctomycetes bacterium ADurb.Bin126]|nr:MAG: hypothetical protein BWX88_03836 [Planctomycetes bacterium ADurb.Bin126]
MTPEKVRALNLLSRQLTESLMNAALCAKEIGEIARAEIDHDIGGRSGGNGNGHRRNGAKPPQRPLLDEATLSVIWRGKTLHLGYTQGFRLLSRLARCPNRYITHVDLLEEIWDDEFTDTSVLRAGVQRLRVKLRRGGMGDLADAIAGHCGRYMLNLSARH